MNDTSPRIGSLAVPILAAGLVLVVMAALISGSVASNDRQLVYLIDDTYIHLAVVKSNLLDGCWALNGQAFTPCSSSPLFTLLMSAVGFVLGLSDLLPLAVNSVAGLLLLFLVGRSPWLRRSLPTRLITVSTVVVLTPLTVLMLSGMKHTIQVLFAWVFLTRLGTRLASAGVAPWAFYAVFAMGA